MPVYKRPGAKTYSYDFQLKNRRFSGNTGRASSREAEAYLRDIARPAALKQIAREAAASAALRGEAPLTLTLAAARYWEEAAQHLVNAEDVIKRLEDIVEYFGPERRLDDIRDSDITGFVAKLRSRRKHGREGADLISPATVNRIGVDRLSALFGHARKKWKLRFENEPDWVEHILPEPKPMPREIGLDKRRAIIEDLAEGYRDVVAFAFATGLRRGELLIIWDQVDWQLGLIHVRQKGGNIRRVVMSREVRAILSRCLDQHETHVFTYVCRRRGGTGGGKLKLGQRYPITVSGLRSAFEHMRDRQEITATLHQTRHTRAMTLLRETGNLRAVQQQLGHSRIETTATYYAHVLDDDLRALLDRTDAASTPTKNPTAKKKASVKR